MTTEWPPAAARGIKIDPAATLAALDGIFASHRSLTQQPDLFGEMVAGTNTGTTPAVDASTIGTPTQSSGPVEGGTPAVTQGFGVNGHPGIDLATPVGSHLLAAINGTVTQAGNTDPGGYGNEVEITGPDGLVVRYGHLSAVSVKVGDQVTAGQAIGASGGVAGAEGSGNSTGPHLHFEVRKDGQAIDPTPLLAGGAAIVGGGSASSPTPLSPDEMATAQNVSPQQEFAKTAPGDLTDLYQPKTPSTQGQQGDQQGVPGGQTGNFASDVLEGIGAPVTPENLRAINAWAQAEGTSAANNPLATTEGAQGASSFNSVGVKNYPSYRVGVEATIRTLLNGNYANIISALRNGTNAMAVADAIAASPWGTGPLVKKILGGG